jgi:hypothetical protein
VNPPGIRCAGGEARRKTFHSADDTPTSLTPDGRGLLHAGERNSSYADGDQRYEGSPDGRTPCGSRGVWGQVLIFYYNRVPRDAPAQQEVRP